MNEDTKERKDGVAPAKVAAGGGGVESSSGARTETADGAGASAGQGTGAGADANARAGAAAGTVANAVAANTESDAVSNLDIGERSQRTQELLRISEDLKNIAPNSYQSWRCQADLLLQAIKQLEKREIDPDESVTLMGVRLQENDLREAAEQALRHCAHFATTFDERIALIDEANSVRRTTWF